MCCGGATARDGLTAVAINNRKKHMNTESIAALQNEIDKLQKQVASLLPCSNTALIRVSWKQGIKEKWLAIPARRKDGTPVLHKNGSPVVNFSKIIWRAIGVKHGDVWTVVFKRSSRSKSGMFHDSRTPTVKRSPEFVLSELCRILGEKEGRAAMQHFNVGETK
jgi:hypothetical protein